MKKNIFSILMLLLLVTAAWAGEGDGSKDHPFSGVWQASELASRIDKGKNLYLAYDCDIQNGSITVIDSKLNTQIANGWPAWSPGNVLGSSDFSGYEGYYKNNSLAERKSQLFLITDASASGSIITITGYFSGRYDWTDIVLTTKTVDNVEYYVINTDEDYETFRHIVATGNPYANAVLEANITVTKPIGGGAPQFHYRGTFDGQGHTIDVDSLANDNENHPWGVFQFTEPGCVIRNLKVTGKLTSGHEYLGAIVGEAVGTRLENCISDAKLKNTSSTLPVTGGLIGAGHGVNFIENCAFIGSLQSSGQSSGLVGRNSQMVSIKSCYVAPKSIAGSGSMFTDQISEVETFKNNYQCTQLANGDSSPLGKDVRSTSITKDEVKTGMLCYKLNQNGRKGIVWYQNSDGYPYPFRTNNCKMIVSDDGGSTVNGNTVLCLHGKGFNDDHICSICGATDPVVTIEPLQDSGADKEYSGDIFVGYLRYKLDTNNKTATVKGTHHYAGDLHEGVKNRDATAVHIPETINYGGVEYTVKYIGEKSFNSSVMEYCYIPKTVNNIADDAFNDCKKLKYLHFADGPSAAPGSGPEAGVYMGHKDKTDELFYDCPLEKVYIGRNLRWYSSSANPDEPFEDRDNITDVFFGPRVTRVGNANYSNAHEGWSYDLFNYCEGISKVYFMGDAKSLNTEIEVWCSDGMDDATDYYVNRSIKTTEDSKEYVTYHEDGIFNSCENVSFGPFVKYIADELFGKESSSNNTLKSVDLNNTFNLEKIGDYSFNACENATFNADFSNSKLTSIGEQAFRACPGLTSINLGNKLESIGDGALAFCGLVYISIPNTVTKFGSMAMETNKSLLGVKFEDGDTPIVTGDLGGYFWGCSNLSSLYMGRQIEKPADWGFNFSPFNGHTLQSIEIGPKVKSIDVNPFRYSTGIGSISFDYSSEPLIIKGAMHEVFNSSKDKDDDSKSYVSSVFIDRKLVDKDGKELQSKDWGDIQKTLIDLTFGNHITKINDSAFKDFTGLNILFFSPTIKYIGQDAFRNASDMKSLIFNGATEIGASAFANCNALETIVFADGNIKLGDNAFEGCKTIKDITINSDGNTLPGPASAFSDEAYSSTELYSPFDTSTEIVVFREEPWSKFQHHPFKRNNDYTEYSSTFHIGNYEHASIEHTVNEGQYEAFYAPFQWDSYYFGSDAEIYSLKLINDNFSEEVSENVDRSTHSIKVEAVDISETRTLPLGVYFVKTNYSAEDLHATRNLFLDNDVYVDNTKLSINNGKSSCFVFRGDVPQYGEPIEEENWDRYIFEDGVMKLLNGKRFLQSGTVSMYSPKGLRDKDIFNIDKNGGATLFTSKRSVAIHSLLEGYATFYNEKYNVLAPSWCEVYVITGEENGEVSMAQIEDRVITAGQAVIIKTNNSDAIGAEDLMTYVTDGSQATDLYSRNLLRGVSENTQVDDICGGDGFVYVLSCNSKYENTGFYKLGMGNTLGAGKAYLLPSDFSNANLAKACLFSFSGGANGIKSTSESMSESDYIYDLSGKRINANQTDAKGIYIIDSKKVVK